MSTRVAGAVFFGGTALSLGKEGAAVICGMSMNIQSKPVELGASFSSESARCMTSTTQARSSPK